MASIRKLANGKWEATVFIGREANNKQIRKYITRATKKECKAAAREMEQEIEDGRFVNIENVRLSTWMDKWLELNKARLSPSTYPSYKMYVEVHFKKYFGQLKLSQINEIHIRQYISDKLKAPLSPTTVRKHFFVLRKILQDVLKHKNPANDIAPPEKTDYTPHVLNSEEFEIIHSAVRGTRDETIVLLSGWCGLRRGEIFALKWDDIDWTKETIRIDEGRALTEDGYIDKSPKSKKGLRVIAAPSYVIDLLDKRRKAQKKITERIFSIRPDHYSSYWAELVVKKNLPKIRFHDLRHYHATWLYDQGIPDQYAAQRLGHDIQVLKGIYQHLNVDRGKEIDDTIRKKLLNFNSKPRHESN